MRNKTNPESNFAITVEMLMIFTANQILPYSNKKTTKKKKHCWVPSHTQGGYWLLLLLQVITYWWLVPASEEENQKVGVDVSRTRGTENVKGKIFFRRRKSCFTHDLVIQTEKSILKNQKD